MLDSCFSAKRVESNGFKPGPMGSRGLGQLAYDKRMRILAASQSDETAGEYASLGSVCPMNLELTSFQRADYNSHANCDAGHGKTFWKW